MLATVFTPKRVTSQWAHLRVIASWAIELLSKKLAALMSRWQNRVQFTAWKLNPRSFRSTRQHAKRMTTLNTLT